MWNRAVTLDGGWVFVSRLVCVPVGYVDSVEMVWKDAFRAAGCIHFKRHVHY